MSSSLTAAMHNLGSKPLIGFWPFLLESEAPASCSKIVLLVTLPKSEFEYHSAVDSDVVQ